MPNKRIIYSCHAAGIASEGTTTHSAIFGLQTLGCNSNFTIDSVYEIGKLPIYWNIEDVPEVEVTMEKVLDGHPLIYHHATSGATDATLIGRSNKRCNVVISTFVDTQNAASGTPIAQCWFSGMFVSSLNYNFDVTGRFTESVSLVGNNKKWILNSVNTGGSPYAFVTGFTPTHGPLAAEGVNFRPHFDLVNSRLPKQIPGVNSTTGVINETGSDGLPKLVLQRVAISASLGRENILQLGKKGPYFRFINVPVSVSCEIGILSREGDGIEVDENDDSNTQDETITVLTEEGTKISLGSMCRLRSASTSGADAGQSNSNQMITYRYETMNDLTVQHPADPTVALRP